MKKKISILLVVFSALILLVSCGPTAHIQKAKHVDFSTYHSYAWVTAKGFENKNKRVGITEQTVKDAFSNQLESRYGLVMNNRNPDLLLSYDILVARSSKIISDPMYSNGFFRSFYNPYYRRFYNVYYPSTFIGYDNYSVPTREGTITISVTDAQTEKTLMQGWATDEVNGRTLTSKQADKIVNAIIKKWNKTNF